MNKGIITVVLLIFTVSCTAVKPWEKGTLAQETMLLDPEPVDNFIYEHIYFSREAATGGASVGGGGCGCN